LPALPSFGCVACRCWVASGSECGFNFVVGAAKTGTHRGAAGLDLALKVVIVGACLAALFDVAAHQLAHHLGLEP